MRDFEVALQKYLKTSNPELLDRLITNPDILLEPGMLASDHDLVIEATIILDSLNSYNQGIQNIDLESELINIPKTSPLFSWRCAVLAIKEFYLENEKMITEYVNDIRDESPLKNLQKTIFKREGSPLYEDDKNLFSSVDALNEVVTNSLQDMYSNTVDLLFRDIGTIDRENLENIALTIIEESLNNIPWDTIQSSLANYTGLKESIRLMALGTLFSFPEKSLEYWFSYVINMDFEDINDPKLKALLSIVTDITKALIKEKFKFRTAEEKKEFTFNSITFLKYINRLHKIELDSSKNPLTNLKKALSFKIPEINDKILRNTDNKNLQLELF